MAEHKISIILLTYNRENLLKRMLDSIKCQTFTDYELVLINNGSTDGTAKICNEYKACDDRIRLITVDVNKGAANARNLGVDAASSEYILMVDDDDYCEPDMFLHLYTLATSENADIAITGCVDEYGDGTIYPKYDYDEKYVWNRNEGVSEFLKREKFHTAPATKLFRKRLFDGLRWTIGTRVDDIHFIYKLFVAADKVVAQGKPMYRFYKHSGNMTAFLSGDILKPDVLEDYLLMQDERVDYISSKIPECARQVRYARVSYMISMVERIMQGKSIDCDIYLNQMKAYLLEHKKDLIGTEWCTDREERLMKEYVGNK